MEKKDNSSKDSGLFKGEQSASNNTKSGFWSGPGNLNTNVEYSEINGLAIVEGDILLGSIEELEKSNDPIVLEKTAKEHRMASESELKAGGIIGLQYRWPNNTLVYEIDPNLPSNGRITDAMDHWTEKTGFKFIGRSTETDYVYFTDQGGCFSAVGKRGGKQIISLGPNCSTGNAIHEIGHAIGLFHEQSRNDRDSNVVIYWQNIQQEMRYNFNQYLNTGYDIGKYDYCSIMHYPRKAFSSNGQDTIQPLRSGAECMGQRDGLSPSDIAGVKDMYPLL